MHVSRPAAHPHTHPSVRPPSPPPPSPPPLAPPPPRPTHIGFLTPPPRLRPVLVDVGRPQALWAGGIERANKPPERRATPGLRTWEDLVRQGREEGPGRAGAHPQCPPSTTPRTRPFTPSLQIPRTLAYTRAAYAHTYRFLPPALWPLPRLAVLHWCQRPSGRLCAAMHGSNASCQVQLAAAGCPCVEPTPCDAARRLGLPGPRPASTRAVPHKRPHRTTVCA